MSARHDLRCNEARWARSLARPLAKTALVETAIGTNPQVARRLATACRLAAHRCEHAATQTQLESLQRDRLQEAADLASAATVLELLS